MKIFSERALRNWPEKFYTDLGDSTMADGRGVTHGAAFKYARDYGKTWHLGFGGWAFPGVKTFFNRYINPETLPEGWKDNSYYCNYPEARNREAMAEVKRRVGYLLEQLKSFRSIAERDMKECNNRIISAESAGTSISLSEASLNNKIKNLKESSISSNNRMISLQKAIDDVTTFAKSKGYITAIALAVGAALFASFQVGKGEQSIS